MTRMLGVAIAVFAVLAGSAAARVCHPLPRGARVAVVHGNVLGYVLTGENVSVMLDGGTGNCPLGARWSLRRGAAMQRLAPTVGACAPLGASAATAVRIPAATSGAIEASGGGWHAEVDGSAVLLYRNGVLAHSFARTSSTSVDAAFVHRGLLALVTRPDAATDRPATLELYTLGNGDLLHRWPLLGGASTFDLGAGIAVYSLRHRDAAYALRLRDGATTLISPIRAGDVPQVDSAGVVYEDATRPSQRLPGRFDLTFVPMRAVARDFKLTFHRLVTPGTITSLAVDGPTVALSFRSPQRSCDQVRIWQALWHDVATPTKEDDEGWSCRGGTAIGPVAVGGITADWVARSARSIRLVSASSRNCLQHLLAMFEPRLARLQAIAANGGVTAFAIGSDGASTLHLGATDGSWSTLPLARVPQGISIDAGRVAVWTRGGAVSLFSESGQPLGSLQVPRPRAVALRGGELVVLTGRRTLAVFDLASGTQMLSRRLPVGASAAVSVRFGIAVVTSGRRVYAVRLSDGRLATLVRTPTPAIARIGDAGVAYAWSTGGRGTAIFVPLRAVQSAIAASNRTTTA